MAGMDTDISSSPVVTSAAVVKPLTALEARVLGCLIEKELATPDIYPLSLNALVNACNQRSNRDPVMDLLARDVESAIEQLRQKHLVVIFGGAVARVPKFKQKIDAVHPLSTPARALLGELILRGPQTLAGLRANTERLHPMPVGGDFDALFAELTERTSGALVRQLPRQPGQKEARWAQLLTGEPVVSATPPAAGPLKVALVVPPEVEQRLTALEAEVSSLRTELARLRKDLGGG